MTSNLHPLLDSFPHSAGWLGSGQAPDCGEGPSAAPRTWSRALVGSAPLGSGVSRPERGRLAPVECEGRSSFAGRRHRRPVDGPRAQSPAADGGGARGRYRPRGRMTSESSACIICPESLHSIDGIGCRAQRSCTPRGWDGPDPAKLAALRSTGADPAHGGGAGRKRGMSNAR